MHTTILAITLQTFIMELLTLPGLFAMAVTVSHSKYMIATNGLSLSMEILCRRNKRFLLSYKYGVIMCNNI